MKVELTDVHADELSRLLQELQDRLGIDLETMTSAAQQALCACGDGRRVVNDTMNVWVLS